MSPSLLSTLFSNLLSIVTIVLFFGGSIFVHELGHFLAARRRGVKVDRFSIGFGPKIFSWTRDGVEYRLSWLPLGGYVALPQLADLSAIEGETPEADRLPPVTYTTKMIVFVAGACFNVLFAFLLACVLWQIGRPAPESLTTTQIGYVAPTLKLADGTEVPSPAAKAGLQIGDIIRRVDGREVREWDEFKGALVLGTEVTAGGGRTAVLTVERSGQLKEITVAPEKSGDEGFRAIGVSPAFTAIIDNVLPGSPGEKLGFKVGDRFTGYDGIKTVSFDQISRQLRLPLEHPLVLMVDRAGQAVELTVPATAKDQPHPLTGVQITTPYRLLHETPGRQLYNIVDNTFRTIWSLVSPRGDLSVANLSGPIGIGRGFWDAAQSDYPIRFAIWFAILVNLNLAIFNLLPIPVLDGGQMLFATVGKLRGRALPINFIAATQSVFIVLLLSMILYVSFFDVRRWARDVRAETKEATDQTKKAAEPAKP